MPVLAPEDRFKAWEAALFEIAGLKREGARAFHRLGEVLRRVRDQRLYLERYASFGRFLAREAGLSREEGEALARAAELFDEGEAAELGREKVRMLAKLPAREVRQLLTERFPSRDHSGAPVQRSVFGLAGNELEVVLGQRFARHQISQRGGGETAQRLQQALDASPAASPFTSAERGAPYVLRDAAGEVIEQRETIDLLGIDAARLPEVLAVLGAASKKRPDPKQAKAARPRRPAARPGRSKRA